MNASSREWLPEGGEHIRPAMANLHKRVPGLEGAIVCTRYGSVLYSIGLERSENTRLVAMLTALFAESESVVDELRIREAGSRLDVVMLSADRLDLVGTVVSHPTLGRVMLVVCGAHLQIGAAVIGVKAAAKDLLDILHVPAARAG